MKGRWFSCLLDNMFADITMLHLSQQGAFLGAAPRHARCGVEPLDADARAS